MAVMAAREGLGFEPPIRSDCAPLAEPVFALFDAGIDVHCLRDCTRGGLATALIEIANCSDVTIAIGQRDIPVSPPVRGACEILGLDPLYVANEGRFAATVAAGDAERALAFLDRHGEDTAIIGKVVARQGGTSLNMKTLGNALPSTSRPASKLPRIC
ncbi:AIR synthase-related protein [Qipengyuania sp.]|uniref:AIR synthase-related protein n=1 Tax=Qipengyuania sp. TaxID=2004515 RepID=UPI0035126CC8